MFSLIITVISIVLVAALALATIYYGGSAFNKNSTEAVAAQFLLEGQQINGAVALAKAESAYTNLQSLVTGNYLTSIPAGWSLDTVDTTYAVKTAPSTAVCAAINSKSGNPGSGLTGTAGCLTADQKAFYKI